MARKNTPFNFEASLGSLESLVEAMEAGDLSLEEALKAFEQGIRLTRECQQALEQAEQKVQILLASAELPSAVPFETDAEGTDDENAS